MSHIPSSTMSRFLRYPLLVLFICSSFALEAQGTSSPAPGKPEPPPSKQTNLGQNLSPPPAAKTENDASVVLLFSIRSAFSLSPSMIHSLQAKSADGSGQGGAQGGVQQDGSSAQRASGSAPEGTKEISWGDKLERMVPFAAPLDVRLVGKNIVALIQILPIALRSAILDLIVQGQVWVKMPDDSLSFKTTVQSLSLPLGSRLYFYPLGVDAKMGAPIAVEIKVDRQSKQ